MSLYVIYFLSVLVHYFVFYQVRVWWN
jgi:hypothetical protein